MYIFSENSSLCSFRLRLRKVSARRADLRQTASAIDMVHGALYNLGLRLSKTIVNGMCDVAELWKHEIEN